MKVTIDCETCGAEGGIWKGGTIPVACPAECDNGQVTLEGDDATDELERREVAKRKALKEYPATDAGLGYLLNAEEREEFERERPVKVERVRIAGRRADGNGAEVVGKAEMSRALGEKLVARLNRVYPKYVRRVVPVGEVAERKADPDIAHALKFVGVADQSSALLSSVAQVTAEGLAGSVAAAPARNAWPFDVALEASRPIGDESDRAARRADRAFAYFYANPAAGFEKRVGGFEAVR